MPPAKVDTDLADLLETSPTKRRQQQSQRQPENNPGICQVIRAHVSYYCYAMCTSTWGLYFCFVLLLLIVALCIYYKVNPTLWFGFPAMKNDYSDISSKFDLDIGKIDHWCLGGGNEGCNCEDPLTPVSRVEQRSWVEAFKENKKQVNQYAEDPVMMADLDVAILGESAVEEMDGRWMGRRPNDELVAIGTIFKNHFHKNKGAEVEGTSVDGVRPYGSDGLFFLTLMSNHKIPNNPYQAWLWALREILPTMFSGDCFMVRCQRTSTLRFGGFIWV